MSENLTERFYAFLQAHQVLTLAYIDRNSIEACALWYAVDKRLQLFFLSSESSRHGAALAKGGAVAFTIQKEEQEWQRIQGIQGRGYCYQVALSEQTIAWENYIGRFPFIKQQFSAISAALSHSSLWSIRPTWLRLIDNSVAFGHKEELQLNSETTA